MGNVDNDCRRRAAHHVDNRLERLIVDIVIAIEKVRRRRLAMAGCISLLEALSSFGLDAVNPPKPRDALQSTVDALGS